MQPHGLLMALRALVDSRTAAADTERAAFLRQVQPEDWKDPETFSEPELSALFCSPLYIGVETGSGEGLGDG